MPEGESRAFHATEAAKALDVLSPQVARALIQLEKLGMIRKHERKKRNESQKYSRVASALWAIVATTIETVEGRESTTRAKKAD